MFNLNRRRYLLETSDGEVLDIHYRPYAGVCCRTLKDGRSWTVPVPVLKDSLRGLGAYLDRSGNIHLLCQDAKSNLVYINRRNGSWYIQPVTKGKNDGIYEKHPYICGSGDEIHFFYILSNSGSRVLIHQQLLPEGHLSSPLAIDTIRKGTGSFFPLYGPGGEIHLFYLKPMGKELIPGYRVFDPRTAVWGEFTGLGSGKPEELLLAVCGDKLGNLHVCMQRILKNGFELVHMEFNRNRKGCRNETRLAQSSLPFEQTAILPVGNRLVIYWVAEDMMHYCCSEDSGDSWGKPQEYRFAGKSEVYCGRLYTSRADRAPELYGTDIPVCLTDGVLPALPEGLLEKREEEDAMKEWEERLKKLELRVQELELSMEAQTREVRNGNAGLEKFTAELESLKKALAAPADGKASVPATVNIPVMPGVGFAQITADYLKQKRE